MNKQPIETARDSDLRLSPAAMRRAARQARELAAKTGTAIVFSQDRVIEHICPQQDAAGSRVHKPPAPYGDRP